MNAIEMPFVQWFSLLFIFMSFSSSFFCIFWPLYYFFRISFLFFFFNSLFMTRFISHHRSYFSAVITPSFSFTCLFFFFHSCFFSISPSVTKRKRNEKRKRKIWSRFQNVCDWLGVNATYNYHCMFMSIIKFDCIIVNAIFIF